MNYVDLSGPYDFSALDLGSSSGECSFPLQLNKNFVINDFILLCNYVTKIYWDDICECLLLYCFFIYCCQLLVSFHVIIWLIFLVWLRKCISSWDLGECSSYLVSSYEFLLASLHVWRIIIFDSRLVVVHLRLWLGLISRLAWFIIVDYLMMFQTRIHLDNKDGLNKMLP